MSNNTIRKKLNASWAPVCSECERIDIGPATTGVTCWKSKGEIPRLYEFYKRVLKGRIIPTYCPRCKH